VNYPRYEETRDARGILISRTLVAAPVVTVARNTDRHMRCAACQLTATTMVLKDGKSWASACETHLPDQLRQAVSGHEVTDCERCDGTGRVSHRHPMTGRTMLTRCVCVAGVTR
jgi:hypothetical protein